VRSFGPPKKAVLWFVAAYLLLRRGERAKAAQHLHDLTQLHPEFPDPWVWLAAVSDDPARRIEYLENAVLLESAHPLARDALAFAQGRVSRIEEARGTGTDGQVQVADCPQCGGTFQYRPGAALVECQYCGTRLPLQETDLIDREATLISDLQLQRRLEGHVWQEVQRLVHCGECGAELTMTHHLTRQCIFCGSTTVLVKDSQQSFEQPDGFLPLKLDEGQAAIALDKAQRSTVQRLKTWWTGLEQEFTRLQAVYLPFWVFDGFVEVRRQLWSQGDADALQALSQLAGDRSMPDGLSSGVWLRQQVARSRQHRVSLPGKDLLIFDNLLYSAMDLPPPELLKQALPFRLGGMVPYEPRLLADWPAALYHRDVETVVKDAYDAMLKMAVWRKRRQVLGRLGDPDQLRRMFQVTTVTYQLVLLPVWVGLAQRDSERRLVLVNGQTGKVVFGSPVRRRSEV
jgi:DNA-directed RNA polymerase subunit RPC12/RpoP